MKYIVVNKNNFLIFLILFFVCTGCSYNDLNVNIDVIEKNNVDRDDVIDDILLYDDSFDRDFLVYISEEYGTKSLNDILSYMDNDSYDVSLWHYVTGVSLNLLYDYYNNVYENVDNVKFVDAKGDATISFVGDISLADDWEIIPYYDSRGEGVYGILGTNVVEIMNSADIMVANNEFTVSNRGSKLPNKYYTFRAKPERLAIYNEMGVDIVSIANNHAYDYGEDAFLDTLDYLKEYDIPYVGGGRNIEEATSPYYFIVNGYKIAFIGATRAEKYILTPEATDTSSGVFRTYDPSLLIETISEVKKNSDYVIVLIHWGREDSHVLEDVQIETGKKYIDAGADLIVGSHAHVLQGMEFYNDKLIAHNLGDFIFNRETKDTGILSVTIGNDGSMSYEFIPCFQSNFKTILLEDTEKNRVISDMRSYSINTTFDDSGYFYASN